MDVESPEELNRLLVAVEQSRKRLRPFREFRREAVEQYVGRYYSDDGSPHRVPVNFLEMAIGVYQNALVANNPSALVTSARKRNKPSALKLELALNNAIDVMNLKDDLRMWVLDSLFSVGIMKTGIAYDGEALTETGEHANAAPYADYVSLDDFVIDMSAKRLRAVAFMGHRIRVSYEAVMDSDVYDKAAKKDLKPTQKEAYTGDGDEKTETISQGSYSDSDEYSDMIELLELWLPQEQMLVTVHAGDRFDEVSSSVKPLNVVEWAGRKRGPFHILGFSDVPDQIMPLAPMALWRDLSGLGNDLFAKLARQATRQKTILGVQGSASEDGNRVVNVADGEVIKLDNPEGVKEHRFGGPDGQNQAMFMQVKDLFSWSAGNLDLMAGLGPQSDTLGQDKLLAGSASKRMSSMQDRVMNGTSEILRDIAYYLYTDPVSVYQVKTTLPHTGMDVRMEYRPEERLENFFEHEIKITPFSMRELSPADRLQTVMQVVTQIIPALGPQMQQQGISLDVEGLLRMFARYTGIDELEDFIVFSTPSEGSQESEAMNQEQAAKPAKTTRIYDRVHRPGATGSGKDGVLQRMLLGGNVQDSEMAAVGRPTG